MILKNIDIHISVSNNKELKTTAFVEITLIRGRKGDTFSLVTTKAQNLNQNQHHWCHR
jgi:hypothetical protein